MAGWRNAVLNVAISTLMPVLLWMASRAASRKKESRNRSARSARSNSEEAMPMAQRRSFFIDAPAGGVS